MGRPPLQLAGRRFGRLVAEEIHERLDRGNLWRAKCDCGKTTIVIASNLTHGTTRSCGCLKEETLARRSTIHGQARTSGKTRLYTIWKAMRQRCNDPNAGNYAYYGGRGIGICAEWAAFAPFRDWANANGYNDGLTIDRIDNDESYSPGNCRWATMLEQNRNRRPVKPYRVATGGALSTNEA